MRARPKPLAVPRSDRLARSNRPPRTDLPSCLLPTPHANYAAGGNHGVHRAPARVRADPERGEGADPRARAHGVRGAFQHLPNATTPPPSVTTTSSARTTRIARRSFPLPPASASSSVSTCSASSCKTASRSFTPSSRWSRQRRRRIPRCTFGGAREPSHGGRVREDFRGARLGSDAGLRASHGHARGDGARRDCGVRGEGVHDAEPRGGGEARGGVRGGDDEPAEARGWRLDATGGRTCSGRRRRRRPRRTSRPWSSSTRRCCTPRSWSASW